MILGGKRENLEFEKLSHFLNFLDFQLLSQQVLSRVVVVSRTCTLVLRGPFIRMPEKSGS